MFLSHTLTIQKEGVVYGYILLYWYAQHDYIWLTHIRNGTPPLVGKDRKQKTRGLRRYKDDLYSDFIIPFLLEISNNDEIPMLYKTKRNPTLERIAYDLDFKQITHEFWIRGNVDQLLGSSFYAEPNQRLDRVEIDLRNHE